MTTRSRPVTLDCRPLTPERWQDFVKLFGKRGAYGGCWCMWWRLKRAEFERQQGAGNRRAMKKLVDSGQVPGILGYDGDEPIGWCSVGPRESYGALMRSRVLKALDETPAWSIVCLFVARPHRGRRVAEALARGTVEYAMQQGASVIEAYPTRPRKGRLPPVSSFMGVPTLFEHVGFIECARPSASRLIMRYVARANRAPSRSRKAAGLQPKRNVRRKRSQ
ncbi:MAG: GNAT family N-acetyltransferase [Acidobacteriota bacterium]|nr:MAG: GNAT family N-acetyltransferase [Acidobacteriota bacterium]